MDDIGIIALLEVRSEQAIEELGKKHARNVSQVAFNILHDVQDVEEVVNDSGATSARFTVSKDINTAFEQGL